MKTWKLVLPYLLIVLSVFCFGCARSNRSDVKEAVTKELDLLKDLDSGKETALTYGDLFSDEALTGEISEEINDVFLLYFKEFDYKIGSVTLGKGGKTARADVELTTLDGKALAKDYAAARLRSEIESSAQNEGASSDSLPLEEQYLILNHLLKTQDYDSVRNSCQIQLTLNNGVWEINRSSSLENALVGGLISSLSDPDILSPEETVEVYLLTLKKMNTVEMRNYLGLESLLSSEESTKNAIAEALVDQLTRNFDFSVTDGVKTGYSATVNAEITTFDSDSILAEYQKELDEFLATPEAVINGTDVRYEKSHQLLLAAIQNNKQSVIRKTVFHLVNDGVSWKLKDTSTELGNALFGTLTEPPSDPE